MSIVLTSDASRRRLPPSSSSCYHSNVWELQSWTKTPLNYLKWSNSTASALTGLLSLQMDILYLAVANVSIWALIFHGEQLLFWCLLVGKLPPQGNHQGQNLPGKPRASGEDRSVPKPLEGSRQGVVGREQVFQWPGVCLNSTGSTWGIRAVAVGPGN